MNNDKKLFLKHTLLTWFFVTEVKCIFLDVASEIFKCVSFFK
jgi:hypothetical protein